MNAKQPWAPHSELVIVLVPVVAHVDPAVLFSDPGGKPTVNSEMPQW